MPLPDLDWEQAPAASRLPDLDWEEPKKLAEVIPAVEKRFEPFGPQIDLTTPTEEIRSTVQTEAAKAKPFVPLSELEEKPKALVPIPEAPSWEEAPVITPAEAQILGPAAN